MGLKTWEAKIGEKQFRFKLKKDDAGRVARRIKDAVNLRQFNRQISNGYDGKDFVSTTMALFGNGEAPIRDLAAYQSDLAAALDKWAPVLITEANLADCVNDFVTIFEKHIPVLDTRKNAEQLAADSKEREEREAERAAREKAALTYHLTKFSTGPEAEMIEIRQPGSMAIYLETIFDNSDAMTDYYDPHRQVGPDLLLAIVPKQAKTQSLARMAISRYTDLAGIDSWTWHTEDYSMGKGNYLVSSYCVDVHDGNELRRCQYAVKFDEYSKGKYPYKGYPGNSVQSESAESVAPVSNSAATISHNSEKNGIEIRFSDRPAESVLARLKSHGWRWSRFSKCWYTKQSASAEAFASDIVASMAPQRAVA